MGKRNLAIVGTHDDFFAEVFDDKSGNNPSLIAHCASPEDAATSYFNDMFHNSNGLVRTAVVAVWSVERGPDDMKIFDARAVLTPCTEPDAEPGEQDVFLDVRERV